MHIYVIVLYKFISTLVDTVWHPWPNQSDTQQSAAEDVAVNLQMNPISSCIDIFGQEGEGLLQ